MPKLFNTQKTDVNAKNQKVANRTIELLLTSTAHGLPNILRANSRTHKAMWFICLIISIGFCVFFINRSLNEYLSFEITTKINVIYDNGFLK